MGLRDRPMILTNIFLFVAVFDVLSFNQGSQYRTGIGRTSMYTDIEISTFRTGLNTGQFRAIPADTERTSRYKKKFLFFIFLSFVIFEFLLGQNDNLFALIY